MAGRDHKKAAAIRAKTNVNGGAIAIGHPTGATGARMIMTLMYELRLRRQAAGDSRPYYGLATLCGGIGEGEAVICKVGDLTGPGPCVFESPPPRPCFHTLP